MLAIVFIVSITFILFKLIKTVLSKITINRYSSCRPAPQYTLFKKILSYITYPVIKFNNLIKNIFSGIVDTFKIFFIMGKNWKSDNCPEIIWEEDEKNNKN